MGEVNHRESQTIKCSLPIPYFYVRLVLEASPRPAPLGRRTNAVAEGRNAVYHSSIGDINPCTLAKAIVSAPPLQANIPIVCG